MHSIEKTCWATGAGPKSASETSAASVDDKMKSRKPVAKPEDPAKASPTLAKKISGTSAGWSVRGSFTWKTRLCNATHSDAQKLGENKVLVGIDRLRIEDVAFFCG